MSGARRPVALIACSLVLGGLAASDVARQEQRLREQLGAPVPVVVATQDIQAGAALRERDLAVRHVPRRYAPAERYSSPAAVAGLSASRAIQAGADVQPALLDDASAPGAGLRPGESVAQLNALASPELVRVGSTVDVVVTEDAGGGRARTVLRGAEVLGARGLPRDQESDPQRVEVSLRVRLSQIEGLARAQDYAHAVRVVPRLAG